MPPGVTQIHIAYDYSDRIPSTPGLSGGNTLDIGLFDQQGHAAGTPGFRGWSGSDKHGFTVGRDWATPPYRPGEIESGTWFVLLGPYKVGPNGLDYRVQIWLNPGLENDTPEPTTILHGPRRIFLHPPNPAGSGAICTATPYSPTEIRGRSRWWTQRHAPGWISSLLLITTVPAGPNSTTLRAPARSSSQAQKRRHTAVTGMLGGSSAGLSSGHQRPKRPRRPSMTPSLPERSSASTTRNRWVPHWEYGNLRGNHAIEVWNGPWGALNAIALGVLGRTA